MGAVRNAEQCEATARGTGRRCQKPALVGTTVCRTHGGSLPSVRDRSRIAREERERGNLERRLNLRGIDPDDPEARGDVALAAEIRRTVAWIRYCEDQILALGGDVPDAPDALADVLGSVGLVSRETRSGMERDEATDLTIERFEAGVGVWEEKLRWNRSHLAGLTKQWIAAGFEARRLELAERTLDALERAIDGVLGDLGLNPRDPDVRATIKRRLIEAAQRPELPPGGDS